MAQFRHCRPFVVGPLWSRFIVFVFSEFEQKYSSIYWSSVLLKNVDEKGHFSNSCNRKVRLFGELIEPIQTTNRPEYNALKRLNLMETHLCSAQ